MQTTQKLQTINKQALQSKQTAKRMQTSLVRSQNISKLFKEQLEILMTSMLHLQLTEQPVEHTSIRQVLGLQKLHYRKRQQAQNFKKEQILMLNMKTTSTQVRQQLELPLPAVILEQQQQPSQSAHLTLAKLILMKFQTFHMTEQVTKFHQLLKLMALWFQVSSTQLNIKEKVQ